MSPRKRRKRPYDQPHPELDVNAVLRGAARTVTGRDGTWMVRTVTSNEKAYTCPGCHQIIPVGTEHVVAYQQDHLFGADAGLADRRHWHPHCWRARR